MADPLSVAGLVLGGLQVGAKASASLLDVCSSLRNAPSLIAALLNEANDARLVLERAQDAGDALSALPNADPHATEALRALRELLLQAKELLAELDALSRKLDGEKRSSKRIKWILQESNAARLKDRLRETRIKISDVIVSSTSATTSRIRMELSDVSVLLPQAQLETQTKIDALACLTQTVQRTVDDASGMVRQIHRTTTTQQLAISSHERQLGQLSMLVQAMMAQQQSSASTARPASQPSPRSNSRNSRWAALPGHVAAGFSSETLILVNLRPRAARCIDSCPCICHLPAGRRQRKLSMALPTLLKSYFGGLFLGYSGLPDAAAACDIRSCAKERRAHLRLSYAFPAWCALPPLHVLVEASIAGSLRIGLVQTRVANPDELFPLMEAIHATDLPTLRRILERDPMLARSTTAEGADAVLLIAVHMAITRFGKDSQLEIVKSLVYAGADFSSQVSYFGMPKMAYYSLVIPNCHPRRAVFDEISRLTNLSAFLDGVDPPLSFVQKVVAGIYPVPLEVALSTANKEILDQLVDERPHLAPLSLACARGDADSVRSLLRHGAPVTAAAAHQAAISYGRGAAACITALIKAGYDVKEDGEILKDASFMGNVEAIPVLVQAGAPIDGVAGDLPPLSIAVLAGNLDTVRTLCELGAKIDVSGCGPLSNAIRFNRHSIMRVLLDHGAGNSPAMKKSSAIILPYAARYADAETMGVVTELDLRGCGVSQDNWEGARLRWLFEKRAPPPTDELREAFERLFAAAAREDLEAESERHDIDPGSDGEVAGSGDEIDASESDAWSDCSSEDGQPNEDEDVFFDACETPAR